MKTCKHELFCYTVKSNFNTISVISYIYTVLGQICKLLFREAVMIEYN